MTQTALDSYYSEAGPIRSANPLPVHPWAVLLAGGDGVRLRDLTRCITGDSRPKQFCPIMGEESLFTQTRKRISPLFQSDRQVFVLSRVHAPHYAADLIDAGGSCIIEQPLNRGTGVAMAVALLRVLQRDPHALIAFFPCDHFYANDDSFRRSIRSAFACATANPGSIILVGAQAEYAEVDYGWIEPGTVLCQSPVGPLSYVHRFWEKPSHHQAETLLNRGCVWNTFVTLGRATTFFDLLCSELPETIHALSRAISDNTLELEYDSLPSVDFSRDVLAHVSERLLVLHDRMSGWVDLGSPARVLETLNRNGIEPEWAVTESAYTFNKARAVSTIPDRRLRIYLGAFEGQK
jgi:mannose-1-phosphate guanylyltransferase